MKFKKLTDGRGFELAEYVKDFLVRHKDYEVKIYLGCDSQNKSTNTTYATTVVFHIENTGCHIIYKKEEVEPFLQTIFKFQMHRKF